ncbi:class II aldolase/adducin family protein [Caulobacter segnis]|uniref:class II aldolase/adducin family protein n=1 Tax=Caulobacter segnis TaxID=88688 RepID=UPI00240EE76A|nr:class II aldolase/adducin family protein [Caulobacter segnis]MDG2520326.1 class II aldolase/adducin family protein [Caulobacter segnis]
MDATEAALREKMVEVMLAMDARGLNRGTSGNISARLGEGVLVTPSGVPPHRLVPEQMVFIDAGGNIPEGQARPSSEWRMHHSILELRPDAGAVVHCHSRHATILACAGHEIPPLHYMVAVSGGPRVPVAPYATFGSEELAKGVVEALAGRRAALMANHGQIALGPDLDLALLVAEEIEEQAAVYWGCLAIGGPKLLDDAQMGQIARAFARYGQKPQAGKTS